MGDVYIYPTNKEGIGLTITEAMCSGMPVVTSNYPTMTEWLDDDKEGRLIRPGKIKRLMFRTTGDRMWKPMASVKIHSPVVLTTVCKIH